MDKALHKSAGLWLLMALTAAGWLLLAAWAPVRGEPLAVRYVAANGDCGANGPCYASVQAAVDAAQLGDILRVAGGHYTGVSTRNGVTQLVYLDKSLTLQGGYDPLSWTFDPVTHPAILDAAGQGRVLYVTGVVSPVLDGFHMTNGVGGNGGGVYVEQAAITLSGSEIYSNRAEGFGGGVYLKSSAATLTRNHIYTNTTGPTGRGGGMALLDSPATVTENVIEDNAAHVGGGVMVNSTLAPRGARLAGNIIRNNVAFDRQEGNYTFDGAGGGLDLSSYPTADTVENNTVSGNCAKWGGGVHAFGAAATIMDNTFQQNTAPYHGGGLYIQGGQITLEGNRLISNTADSWGGGLTLLANDATVRNNTFRGNHAGWRGGGMYAESAAHFDSNIFLHNTAAEQGGGAFLIRGDGAVHQNSVFAGNQAAEGGGVYLWAASVRLVHVTLAGNSSGDGRAVVIDKYPGLVDPDAATLYTATVVFSNVIVAGQPAGFFVTPGNSLTVAGVLWWEVPTHFQAAGAALTVLNEQTGDPQFQPDGYHLRTYSAARDRGAGDVTHDVDGQLRPWGDVKDLGADEHVPVMVVGPETGGELTYIDAQEEVTLTVAVPPGAVTRTVALMLSPFPPLPPDVTHSPFGQFIPFGPPFQLEAFAITLPVSDPADPPIADYSDVADAVIFERYPAHVIAEIGVERLKGYYKSMERLELQLLALLDAPSPPRLAACGLVQRDIEGGILDTPICDNGVITAPSAAGPSRLVDEAGNAPTGWFILLLEEMPVYLPVVSSDR